MILRLDRDQPGREILRWRFLSLALPPGILLAATVREGFRPSETLRLLDKSMAPDQVVAHHHVHHAATVSFEELWSSLMFRALLHPGDLAKSLCDLRAYCPGLHTGVCFGGRSTQDKKRAKRYWIERRRHMTEWSDVLRQAFIGRRVLDRHSHHSALLESCPDIECRRAVATTLRGFVGGKIKSYCDNATPHPWPNELIGLARRWRDDRSADLANRRTSSGRDFMRQQTSAEHRLLVRAFAHLRPEDAESIDPVYERLFLQYMRIKAAVFGLLVHPPGEKGLSLFLEHFLQIKVYAPEADILRPRAPKEPGLQVGATEYRIAPDAWFNIWRRDDAMVEQRAHLEGGHQESAWLIHFKRDGHGSGLPLYASAINRMESDADRIMRGLHAHPEHLKSLRGIDICGVEEQQPLWVSAETLRRVVAHSRSVAANRPWLHLKPLRLTLHAGEDFNWLTSGIRAVAEPFYWNLLERGDRLGHGIAITLNPQEWWKQHAGEVVCVGALDRFLDLAFLAAYTERRTEQQESWLAHEIRQVASFVWPLQTYSSHKEAALIDQAKKLWRGLGGRLTRSLLETASGPGNGKEAYRTWLHLYLWSRTTQKRATTKIPLTIGGACGPVGQAGTETECELLTEARKRLIRQVAALQVCIESNPSSNFLVGGLEGVAAQSFLQQRPTIEAERGRDTLTWTISTDDPITFSTTLADEYAYAWAGMLLRQHNAYDASFARALLDEAAADFHENAIYSFSFQTPQREKIKSGS